MSCQVCIDGKAKYTCPRCQVKTCCVGCVKKHKESSPCDGKRDKTAFVSLKTFSENNLKSDYHFLEDASRKIGNAGRENLHMLRQSRHRNLHKLVTKARKRGINLQTLPYSFQRRRANATTYWNKTDKIMWQTEWVFPDVGAKFTDSRVCEERLLSDILKSYLHPTESDPIKRHRLRRYVKTGMENCTVCMKQQDAPANSNRFYKMEPEKTLSENLKGKVILEYPTLYVLLPEEAEAYDLIET